MIKLEPLEFGKNETNASVTKKISDRIKSIPLEEITKELSKDFVFQEQTIRKLYTAISTGKNSILFGPGGYSKTVIIKAFCELLKIPITIKVGHSESSTEDLLGIPNMKKLMEESKLETAFENSVFSKPGLLILEEFTDVKPSVAASLKDVITEHGFRENNLFKESLISSIIITGNEDPKNIAIDDSIKAFYNERFPIQHNVMWEDFSEQAYMKFFNVYFKDLYNKFLKEFILLSKLCSNNPTAVSPRVAADAGDIIITLGINYLDTVSGIDTSELESYNRDVKEKYQYESENYSLEKIKKKISTYSSWVHSSKSSEIYLKTFVLLHYLLEALPSEVTTQSIEKLIHVKNSIQELQLFIIEESPKSFNFMNLVTKTKHHDFEN
jgi:hypothetical protein